MSPKSGQRIISFSTTVNLLLGGATAVSAWALLFVAVPLTTLFIAALLGQESLPFDRPYLFAGPALIVIGVVMAALAMTRGRKVLALLRRGKLIHIKASSKEATNAAVRGQTVYLVKYRFDVEGKRYLATKHAYEPEELVDTREEPLLYLRDDPSQASLVGLLPGRLRIKDRIADSSDGRALLHLVLPVFVVLEVVVFIVRALIT